MRFAFGKNWQSYSQTAISPERIDQARAAFARLTDGIELADRRFIDIGFGQGLSLMIATEMGAHTLGIDIDDDNREALAATQRAMGGDRLPDTRIASILDPAVVAEHRGCYDIVHSWGVLHHTGDMRQAIAHACALVADDGHLIIAIYNRHWTSPIWTGIKWTYCALPALGQRLAIALMYPVIWLAKYAVTGQNPTRMDRGMDFMHDVIDWVGGYPYEYGSIAEIEALVLPHGFTTLRTTPAQVPTGCNELLFRRTTPHA